ncbi:tol-pal system protein YbgF [Coralloluteibacterium stylophorae]|uniref:Cell division coordinator CpoB n=1 Tax=Coralloluteibacterium stylophorae TaxID=1776034 RepID=A0A8J7VUS2_9GAMM|nr:tol-pal system protein YbgF [Coralloluteibacterium stylophorae]MBS7456770.1 tol-pal system protein YbgF [Coralloluteibacterium stylophorae]
MHVKHLQVAIVAAAFMAAAPVSAQRASLADRVARLEQQQAGGQSSVEQVNRIMTLQSEVQSLRGQVEELRNQIEQMQTRGRQQYLDLDSRIGRLEGGAGAASADPAAGSAGASGPAAAGESEPVGELRRIGESVIPGSALGGGDAGALPVDPAAERADYQVAFNALKEGQYADAATRFREFIERHPQSELIDNANYWLGESYYVTQNYELALQAFQTLVTSYPESPKAPGALLKTGYCQLELGRYDAGEATLREVIREYPGTPESSLADGRLRGLVLDRQGG